MTTNSSRKGPGKWSNTFQWWVDNPPGAVKVIDKSVLEEEGYESTYVRYFNAISDAGWKREKGKWVSPDGTLKFDKIELAYKSYLSTKIRERE